MLATGQSDGTEAVRRSVSNAPRQWRANGPEELKGRRGGRIEPFSCPAIYPRSLTASFSALDLMYAKWPADVRSLEAEGPGCR